MKYVVDANLAPGIAVTLSESGFDSIHVADVDLLSASDQEIFDWAVENERAIITADSDFAMLLAFSGGTSPSVLQLRGVAELKAPVHLQLLLDNLPTVEEALSAGAVVSLNPDRLRVRDLPIER